MPQCLIGLGSNLGDRGGLLNAALARLQRHPQIEVVNQSRHHETLPVGGPCAQPAYLNAAAVLQTTLPPGILLAELQKVETSLGRQRVEHWGPRTIDLDLLLYDDLTLTAHDLVIPHPRMMWRRFVLEPAAEVAPDMLHPGIGWTISQFLEHLNRTPWYLAMTGLVGSGKGLLAGEIAQRTGAQLLADEFHAVRLETFYGNPSSHAWQIELEFLERRAAQLAAGQPGWKRQDQPTVSDFWFGQSAAFASVWLSQERQPAYEARWAELQAVVVQPRLTVMLQAPLEALLARIRTRGRPGEEVLTIERLRQIETAVEDHLAYLAEGPVLRLDAMDQQAAVVELTAAVEAMR